MLNATLSQREGETSAFLCDSKSVKYIHQIFRFGKETSSGVVIVVLVVPFPFFIGFLF